MNPITKDILKHSGYKLNKYGLYIYLFNNMRFLLNEKFKDMTMIQFNRMNWKKINNRLFPNPTKDVQ